MVFSIIFHISIQFFNLIWTIWLGYLKFLISYFVNQIISIIWRKRIVTYATSITKNKIHILNVWKEERKILTGFLRVKRCTFSTNQLRNYTQSAKCMRYIFRLTHFWSLLVCLYIFHSVLEKQYHWNLTKIHGIKND